MVWSHFFQSKSLSKDSWILVGLRHYVLETCWMSLSCCLSELLGYHLSCLDLFQMLTHKVYKESITSFHILWVRTCEAWWWLSLSEFFLTFQDLLNAHLPGWLGFGGSNQWLADLGISHYVRSALAFFQYDTGYLVKMTLPVVHRHTICWGGCLRTSQLSFVFASEGKLWEIRWDFLMFLIFEFLLEYEHSLFYIWP